MSNIAPSPDHVHDDDPDQSLIDVHSDWNAEERKRSVIDTV